jgi:Protein of unknown function (DUF2777).
LSVLKETLLEKQKRAFCPGTIEKVGEEWVFFDEESGEACPLEQLIPREVAVWTGKEWKKGILSDPGLIRGNGWQLDLPPSVRVKIRRQLPLALRSLIGRWQDETFLRFVKVLNDLGFSLYDVLYSHDQQSLTESGEENGVNFFIFDNTEQICSVHHHFDYGLFHQDRFVFTLSTGKQAFLQLAHWPHARF